MGWFFDWGRRTHAWEMGWERCVWDPREGRAGPGFKGNISKGSTKGSKGGSIVASGVGGNTPAGNGWMGSFGGAKGGVSPDAAYHAWRPAWNAASIGGAKGKAGPDGPYHAFKMLIPKDVTGAVVGHDGATIAALREASGARLSLSERNIYFPGTDCQVLSLQSESPESLVVAAKLTYEKLLESGHSNRTIVSPQNGAHVLQVIVPKDAASKIIGTRGATIQQLRESTGAQFKVVESQIGFGPSAEQIVRITGVEESVASALECVIDYVQQECQQDWFFEWGRRTHAHEMGWEKFVEPSSWGGKGVPALAWPGKGGGRKGPANFAKGGGTTITNHGPWSTGKGW